MERKFNFWQKWLSYANVMTIIIGFLVAFAGNSFIFDLHNAATAEVFFGEKEIPSQSLELKNWLFGIIGGTMIGFHVLMLMISENSFKNKEPWAYKAMWFGLVSWFIVDSGISIYFGAIHNVLLVNIFALFLIGLPLVMTLKYFRKSNQN